MHRFFTTIGSVIRSRLRMGAFAAASAIRPQNASYAPIGLAIRPIPPLVLMAASKSQKQEMSDSENDDDEDEDDDDDDPGSAEFQHGPDLLLRKAIASYDQNSMFMLKFGNVKVDKERECYSGYIISDDLGKIWGNQIVLPGGKKKKLTADERGKIVAMGLGEGKVLSGHTICIEQTAWWAEKSKFSLLRTLCVHTPSVYLIIMDHLGKHMDAIWDKEMATNGFVVAPGAAGHTPTTQMNDMDLNGFYNKGLEHLNNKWMLTCKPNTVPTWSECVQMQLSIAKAYNATPRCLEITSNDYDEAGYTLNFDGSNKEKFLKRSFDKLLKNMNDTWIGTHISPDVLSGGLDIDTCSIDEILALGDKRGRKKNNVQGKRTDFAFSRDEWDEQIELHLAVEEKESFMTRDNLNEFIESLFAESEQIAKHIEKEFKFDKLSDSGRRDILPKVTRYTREYCGEYEAKLQAQRQKAFRKHFHDVGEDANDWSTDWAEGGLDISSYVMKPKTRADTIEKTLASGGLWSKKRHGKMKPNKKSSHFIQQKSIVKMFEKISIRNTIANRNKGGGGGSNNHNHNSDAQNSVIEIREPPKKKRRKNKNKSNAAQTSLDQFWKKK
eukprot:163897_1